MQGIRISSHRKIHFCNKHNVSIWFLCFYVKSLIHYYKSFFIMSTISLFKNIVYLLSYFMHAYSPTHKHENTHTCGKDVWCRGMVHMWRPLLSFPSIMWFLTIHLTLSGMTAKSLYLNPLFMLAMWRQIFRMSFIGGVIKVGNTGNDVWHLGFVSCGHVTSMDLRH